MAHKLKFGSWTVDFAANQLRSGEREVSLDPQAMDVLRALLKANGETVRTDELLDQVWGERQVEPNAKRVSYRLDLKRVIERKLVMGIADGRMSVDGEVIYTATDLKVGLFQSQND